MKKLLFICIISASCFFGQEIKAQSYLENLLSGISSGNSSKSGSDVISSAVNDVISSSTESSANSKAGNILGNIISSVTGSVTTTQANLIGTWSYNEPAVQFESKNLLNQAGGSAAATKVESKLAPLYKMVGIRSGRVKFTFDNDGKMTYTLGSRSYSGTYTFDKSSKTVTMVTSTGQNIKAYVTISGSNMSLCFDSTKALNLFSSISKSYNSTISALADSYDGMKTGFKFTRQ